MADDLKFETALRMARSLTSIPEFPRFEDAITATAFDLIDWCKGDFIDNVTWSPERQAAWVVQEARLNWKKWTGTADFRALFLGKFPTEVEPGNAFHPLGTPPPPQCSKCRDFGTVRLPSGLSEWCVCDTATEIRGNDPAWLDLLNKYQAPKPPPVRREEKPMTPAQKAALKAEDRRMIDNAIDFNEGMIRDPSATKEQKKIARKFLKLYRPDKGADS
jgi:hypothetical protein